MAQAAASSSGDMPGTPGGSTPTGLHREPSFEDDDELRRMPSDVLAEKAKALEEQVRMSVRLPAASAPLTPSSIKTGGRSLVANMALDDKAAKEDGHDGHHSKKKGAFAGVFVPTCENMWGVLIFLRFYFIVGHAGVGQALCAVVLSFCCAFCTTSSMSATVSSGGLVSKGGPYYMISRALGPCVGASVGIMYWLAITMLAVLETLGAVEGILMASPEAEFTGCKQAYGSALLICLVIFVYLGISVVSKLGIFFVFVVFATLLVYYVGLATAPETGTARANTDVTGISTSTFMENWSPHYGEGYNFGYVLSVFFPCFTGILSGANRADILKDPPKNLRQGTFGAIIFSLFMYSSYMILWGMVAKYPYLQGDAEHGLGHQGDDGGRRLAGASAGAYVVEEIVWNPFPKAATVGIIISSLSQALQCIVVAPRLLQSIAKDKIITFFNKLAPLSKKGEPSRALGATYIVAALLVLIGNLDLVAPLLSMCFLVAYAFMNISCFMLTWLRSPAWRPTGIHKRRWRFWYMGTAGSGFCICLSIMFTINVWWALAAICIALCIYFYISWKVEERGWGSAMDGIRYQLALNSLIQLEASQNHHVNWRPQVLILYRIHLSEELKGIKHHEILRFYSQLRKGNGFCVVACVLEADSRDEHALHKARIEKGVIQSIMKEESIQGFSEVVVAPSWVEGTNYIIQLTGIGGLSPNTVLLDWPVNWRAHPHRATDFVNILKTALAEDKAVLAIRGLAQMPFESVYGTIDIWWMIHDGGFLILLSWLLVQHRTWRRCHLRVFTITEGVTEEEAKAAGQLLTRTLRQRRLFDVDVEVILADDEMIEPFTADWTLREERRHRFMEQLAREGVAEPRLKEAIPLEIDDLFAMESDERRGNTQRNEMEREEGEERPRVSVVDYRRNNTGGLPMGRRPSKRGSIRSEAVPPAAASKVVSLDEARQPEASSSQAPTDDVVKQVRDLKLKEDSQASRPAAPEAGNGSAASGSNMKVPSPSQNWSGAARQPSAERPAGDAASPKAGEGEAGGEGDRTSTTPKSPRSAPILNAMVGPTELSLDSSTGDRSSKHGDNVVSFSKLNEIIYTRSKRAQLVVMNLPDIMGTETEEVKKFMSYCDTLTKGLERVLFVHSSGHEIFDIAI